MKIILAEDNIINQKVVIKMLEKNGYVCDLAKNGKEIVEILKENTYEIILMDCQMPELDGYDATKEIRKIEKKQQRKPSYIIALTAFALEGDREKCLQVGMDDYLSKPINFDELLEIIHRRESGSKEN